MSATTRSSLDLAAGAMPVLGRNAPDAMRGRRWTGLLWREHLAHGSLVLAYLGFWLLAQAVFLLFSHPGAVLVFGLFCAVYFAGAFAGGDAKDRALEFSLALPATRRELFLTRFLYSGGMLAAFLATSLLAIRFDWVQGVWGLFVESGYTQAFPDAEAGWYAAAAVAPMAVYACAFALASQATDDRDVSGAGWGAILACLVVGAGAAAAEFWMTGQQSWTLAFALLGLLAVGSTVLGYRGFRVRDAVARPSRSVGSSSGSSLARILWAVLIALIVIGLLSAFFLVGSSSR